MEEVNTNIDDEFQIIEYDEEQKRFLCGVDPWAADGSETLPTLQMEIERILRQAEEAKQSALVLDKDESIDEDAHQIVTETEHVPAEKKYDTAALKPIPCACDEGKVVEEESTASPEAIEEKRPAVHEEPPSSVWKRMQNSTPVAAAKIVMKELILPISVFSIVSYLTLQISEML